LHTHIRISLDAAEGWSQFRRVTHIRISLNAAPHWRIQKKTPNECSSVFRQIEQTGEKPNAVILVNLYKVLKDARPRLPL
jgi:hypothetical protein